MTRLQVTKLVCFSYMYIARNTEPKARDPDNLILTAKSSSQSNILVLNPHDPSPMEQHDEGKMFIYFGMQWFASQWRTPESKRCKAFMAIGTSAYPFLQRKNECSLP